MGRSFRFQTGSIKSTDLPRCIKPAKRFRFQTGSIKRRAGERTTCPQLTQFRFQTGSIKRLEGIDYKFDPSGSFDSKLVRLKEANRRSMDSPRLQFRFQTGSIKRANALFTNLIAHDCFDSKLVRLKALHRFERPQVPLQFRFQTGSIKRIHIIARVNNLVRAFRFQTGSIKRTAQRIILRTRRAGFDSKLVRLKVNLKTQTEHKIVSFDSKLVRLKVDKAGSLLGEGSFDSKLVRLKEFYRFNLLRSAIHEFRFQTGSIKRHFRKR